MTRARSKVPRHRRTKKILKRAKGFWGRRGKLNRLAQESVMRSLAYSYRDRKARKRNFRSLWITRIGAAATERGLSYSELMSALRKANIGINRKILAELAVNQAEIFSRIVHQTKNPS